MELLITLLTVLQFGIASHNHNKGGVIHHGKDYINIGTPAASVIWTDPKK